MPWLIGSVASWQTVGARVVGVLALGVFSLLNGCAPAPLQPDGPRITAVSPPVLQQGKAAALQLQVSHWAPGTQLALMAAGPYVSHRLSLSSPPTAMLTHGALVFLATADGRLSVVDFPQHSDSARQLGQVTLAGVATRLALMGDRLLVVLADGRLQWLDVAQDLAQGAAPVVLATLPSPGKLRDLWVDGESVYFLLAPAQGKTSLQQWRVAEGVAPQRVRQWALPLEARAVAVRLQHAWTVGPDGVAVLDIAGEQALLKDYRPTSGVSNDIQLQDGLALVADGRGGLVLFDVSDPERLQWTGSYNKRGAIRGFAINDRTLDAETSGDDSALLDLRNGTVMRLGLANPELPSSGVMFRPDARVVASALQGDATVLATEHALQRVMMTGNGDSEISPEGLNLGGSRRGVFGKGDRGDILYVADWFSGLHLYDISNPRQLRHISNYHTPGSSKGVALLGNYALVGDDDQGLQIIDVEDPRRPSWTAELPPEAMARLGLAYTMKLVGKTLYLADHRGGFHIIDLSDIYHPRRLGGYDTPGKAWGIDVADNVAFVADDRGGLLMFDVSDPVNPKPFAQFNPGGQAEDVALQDGRAYVAFFDQGLYTLDVRDPHQAKVIGHTPIPGNARGIELDDGLLYVASWEAGLQVVDTRGPVVPKIIGSFDTDGAAWGVKAKDGFAYVLDWWGGIKVVDLSDPARPTAAGRYHARGTLQQLRTRGSYLYAASGAAGLQVYDIKNPLNPIWAKGLDVDGESRDLWIEDDRAYLAAGDGGVAIFDILDPFYTRQLSSIDTPGEATQVRAGNDYLYIADSRAGLLVMDVRDPQRPVEVARYDVPVGDMWLDGQTLWLVSAGEGLTGWAVAEDGTLRQQVSLPGVFSRVRAQGDLLVSSTLSGTVQLWRLTAQGPVALGQVVTGDAVTDLQLDGNTLYLVGPKSGLRVEDITQPDAPRLLAVYPPTGQHTHVAIARGAAFLAGEPKLASVSLLPPLSVAAVSGDAITVQVPVDLPRGAYHLLAIGPHGQTHLLPNAFKVSFAAPGQKKFTLDAFRKILKTPLKPPPESVTELPAKAAKPH